jgi:hypothetical protein
MLFIKKCVSSVFFKCQPKADNRTDAMLAFAHTDNPLKIGEKGAWIPA